MIVMKGLKELEANNYTNNMIWTQRHQSYNMFQWRCEKKYCWNYQKIFQFMPR